MRPVLRAAAAVVTALIFIITSCTGPSWMDGSGHGGGGSAEDGPGSPRPGQADGLGDPDVQLLPSAEVGTLPGYSSVDNAGQAHYSIPIDVAPGVRGMAPQLSISYSSGSGNGLLGVGFSLSGFSSIDRCGKTIADDGMHEQVQYDGDDALCYGGQRLVLVSGSYGLGGSEYRTRKNPFAKILLTHDIDDRESEWEVWTKDGRIYRYGGGSANLVTEGAQIPYHWALREVRDRYDNTIEYRWKRDPDGSTYLDIYPDEIVYAGTGSEASKRKVKFHYVDFGPDGRYDPISGYRSGQRFRRTQLLETIEVQGPAEALLHTYELEYGWAHDGLSVITSVTKCDAQGACLPPTTFDWGNQVDGDALFPPAPGDVSTSLDHDYNDLRNTKASLTGDFDGDSVNELLTWSKKSESWEVDGEDAFMATGPYMLPSPTVMSTFDAPIQDAVDTWNRAACEGTPECTGMSCCSGDECNYVCPYSVYDEDSAYEPDGTPFISAQYAEAWQPALGLQAINFDNDARDDILIPRSPAPYIPDERDPWGLSFADDFRIAIPTTVTEPWEFDYHDFHGLNGPSTNDPIYNIVPLDHDGDGLTDLWLCQGQGYKTSHWILGRNEGEGTTETPYGFTFYDSGVGCSVHDELHVTSLRKDRRQQLLVIPAYETDPALMQYPDPADPGAYLNVTPIPDNQRATHYLELQFEPGTGPGVLADTTGLPRDLYQRWHDADCKNSIADAHLGIPVFGAGFSRDKQLDLNRDGLPDILRFELNTGDTYANIANIKDGLGDNLWAIGPRCGDNVDLTHGAVIQAYINTGEGFVKHDTSSLSMVGNAHANAWLNFDGAQPADWNSDGLVDLVMPAFGPGTDWTLLQSDGNAGFISRPVSGGPTFWPRYSDLNTWVEQLRALRGTGKFAVTAKYSGLTSIRLLAGSDAFDFYPKNLIPYFTVRVRKITDGLGGEEEFLYLKLRAEGLPDSLGSVVGSFSGPTPEAGLRSSMYVVRQHRLEGQKDRHYRYFLPHFDTHGRGFVGFEEIHVAEGEYCSPPEDCSSITRSRFDLTYSEALADYPYAGAPRQVEVERLVPGLDGLGETPNVEKTCHDTSLEIHVLPEGSWFVHADVTTQRSYTGRSESCDELADGIGLWDPETEQTVTTLVDDYGATTEQSVSLRGGNTTTTVASGFLHDEANWLLDHPTRIETTSCESSDCETRVTTRQYDASTGAVEYQWREPGTAFELEQQTELTTDGRGNVWKTHVRDAQGNTRTSIMTWDAEGVFVTGIRNPLGQTSTFAYHASGAVLRSSDPNGITTKVDYDGFFRPLQVATLDSPQGSSDGSDVSTVITDGTNGPEGSVIRIRTTSQARTVTVDLDQNGREIRRSWRGVQPAETFPVTSQYPTGPKVCIWTHYDDTGRPWKVSHPTYDCGATSPSPYSGNWTHYRYDRAHNLREVRTPLPQSGEAVEKYDREANSIGWEPVYQSLVFKSVHTDAEEKQTTTLSDAAGRPRITIDHDGIATCFDYGPWNRIDSVRRNCWYGAQGEQATTSYQYDAIGRLETETDPAFGTRGIVYTGFDEIDYTIDAKGQIVNYTYDDLGRVTHRTDPSGTAEWIWDTYLFGYLTETRTSDGINRSYTYDAWGRVDDYTTEVPVGGSVESLTFSYEYDYLGRLYRTDYPSVGTEPSFSTLYEYDHDGYLRSIHDASKFPDYIWALGEANEAGQVKRELFGNGLVTERGYQPTTFRQQWITTEDEIGTPLQQLQYDWSPVGNLLSREDPINSQSESFTYDNLHRLDTWTIGTSTTDVDYDPLGNITSRSDIGSYTYDASGRLDTFGGTNVEHDANGNVELVGSDQIAWTPLDQVSELEDGSNTFTFKYDADGQRVLRTYPAKGGPYTKVTIDGLYERIHDGSGNVSSFHHRVPDPSGRIVMERRRVFENFGFKFWKLFDYYVHDDHLGSSSLVTRSSGSPAFSPQASYGPWGDARRHDDWTQPLSASSLDKHPTGFTGHQAALDGDYINMRGRMYSPTMGRFLSVDPIVTGPLDGQAWNPYSYVQNRPTVWTDPTGFSPSAGGNAGASSGGSEPGEPKTWCGPGTWGSGSGAGMVWPCLPGDPSTGTGTVGDSGVDVPSGHMPNGVGQGGPSGVVGGVATQSAFGDPLGEPGRVGQPGSRGPSGGITPYGRTFDRIVLWGAEQQVQRNQRGWLFHTLDFMDRFEVDDFLVGWGDAVSIQIGELLRKGFTQDDIVNYGTAYDLGEIAGVLTDLLMGNPAALQASAAKRSARRITTPYKRPSGATTKAQRESVQGKPCVDCGRITSRQVADHKKPLVKEHYETGTIDRARMRSPDAVQPQCPTCSASQGGRLSHWSRRMKDFLGL